MTKGGNFLPGHNARYHAQRRRAEKSKEVKPMDAGAPADRPKPKADASKTASRIRIVVQSAQKCWCGCGGTPRRGKYLPGHDAKLLKEMRATIVATEHGTMNAAEYELLIANRVQQALETARKGRWKAEAVVKAVEFLPDYRTFPKEIRGLSKPVADALMRVATGVWHLFNKELEAAVGKDLDELGRESGTDGLSFPAFWIR